MVMELGTHTREGDGRKIWVNRCMKAFLKASNVAEPTYFQNRQGDLRAGVDSSMGGRRSGSMTILHPADLDLHATRELRKSWKVVSKRPRNHSGKHQSATEYDHRRRLSSPASGWEDIFERYSHSNVNDEILPQYGESDSDNEYDTDTWEEMQREKDDAPPQINHMSQAETLGIIEQAKAGIRGNWASSRRTKLEGMAYHTWKKAQRTGGIPRNIESLQREAQRLKSRLANLEKHISSETWTRADDVRRQCDALHVTLFDLCNAELQIDILQREKPPQKPPTSDAAHPHQKLLRERRPPAEEDDLADEDENDFVVDDIADLEGESPTIVKAEPVQLAQLQLDSHKAPVTTVEEKFSSSNFIDLTMDDSSDEKAAVTESVPLNTSATTDQHGADPSADPYLDMEIHKLRKIKEAEILQAEGRARVAWQMAQKIQKLYAMRKLLALSDPQLPTYILCGLKALRSRKYDNLRGVPESIDGTTVLELARWYFAWIKGFWQHNDGLLPDLLEEVVAPSQSEILTQLTGQWPPNDLSDFLAFIGERLDWTDAQREKRLAPKPKRSHDERSGDESPIDPQPKKRGRPPTKNTARDMQEEAHERQKILKAQRAKYPTAPGQPAFVFYNDDSHSSIAINPHIGQYLQPHQLEGIRFAWNEVVASTKPQGCLLAHSMGTGKTLQIIAFLNTLAEAAQSEDKTIREQVHKSLGKRRFLIIPPPSIVSSFADEFLKWLPEDFAGIGKVLTITPKLTTKERLAIIEEWNKDRGALLISTHMFKDIVAADSPIVEYQQMSELLRKKTSVVIVDEAQELRNHDSKLSRAVRRIDTRARIALTGSPLSNNLDEYWNLLDWVSPGYLGDHAEFKERYVRPISEGLYADASAAQKRKSLKHLSALTRDLEPKVHRIDVSVLDRQLFGKTEFVVRVPLTTLQQQCYQILVESIRDCTSGEKIGQTRLWAYLCLFRLLCNHPVCLYNRFSSANAPSVNDILSSKRMHPSTIRKNSDPNSSFSPSETLEQSNALEEEAEKLAERPHALLDTTTVERELKQLISEPLLKDFKLSNKALLIQEILHLSWKARERVLLFSHSLPTLDLALQIVKKLELRWIRIDGKVSATNRNEQAKSFNQGAADVCLISTQAGGTGLNLFGASRVIIVDSWYNPMFEQQAIGRSYRIGQTKKTVVYRLMTAGTYEETMHNLSAFKSNLADRVVDKRQTVRQATKDARTWLRELQDTSPEDLEGMKGKDPEVLDKILANMDSGASPLKINSIEIGESFLVEQKEHLTAEEQHEADSLLAEQRNRRTGNIVSLKTTLPQAQSMLPAAMPSMALPSAAIMPVAVPPVSSPPTRASFVAPPTIGAASVVPPTIGASSVAPLVATPPNAKIPPDSHQPPSLLVRLPLKSRTQPPTDPASQSVLPLNTEHRISSATSKPVAMQQTAIAKSRPTPQVQHVHRIGMPSRRESADINVQRPVTESPTLPQRPSTPRGSQTMRMASLPVESGSRSGAAGSLFIQDFVRQQTRGHLRASVDAHLEDLIGYDPSWKEAKSPEKNLLVQQFEAMAFETAMSLEDYQEKAKYPTSEELTMVLRAVRDKVNAVDQTLESMTAPQAGIIGNRARKGDRVLHPDRIAHMKRVSLQSSVRAWKIVSVRLCSTLSISQTMDEQLSLMGSSEDPC